MFYQISNSLMKSQVNSVSLHLRSGICNDLLSSVFMLMCYDAELLMVVYNAILLENLHV